MNAVVQPLGGTTVVMEKSHKASWTAAAVYASLQLLATAWIPVSRDGYRALRRFARLWPHARWAIEGATGSWPAASASAHSSSRVHTLFMQW